MGRARGRGEFLMSDWLTWLWSPSGRAGDPEEVTL